MLLCRPMYRMQRKNMYRIILFYLIQLLKPSKGVGEKLVKRNSESFQRSSLWETLDKLNTIPVCKQSFKDILGVSCSRIDNITIAGYKTGKVKPDKQAVTRNQKHNFQRRKLLLSSKLISSLQCLESHYCRGKSLRKYLSAQLTINKLFRMYNGQEEESVKVKQSYFRHIFNSKFNLG